MAKKSAHRDLQRLVEDEIGKRPKLRFCANLTTTFPRHVGEAKEAWLSRLFLENEASLRDSADQREADREEA